ncbi:MAG TPA: anthranilate synthase family protein [Streptomyces sp.]|nr:anthranilate synthase family protein [Streptomyces sp.]
MTGATTATTAAGAGSGTAPAPDLLGRVLGPQPPPFALLHRPESTGPGVLDVLVGEVSSPHTLAAIPLPEEAPADGAPRHEVLALIPYRQITERGHACVDDGAPLIAMTVTHQAAVPVAEALTRLPDLPVKLSGGHFDMADEEYAETVRRIAEDEIGRGEGANFVVKRSFVADIDAYTPASALAFYRRLLERESGAHWTFVVHTGSRTLVGATPERHVSVNGGTAVMNPISGTYRYPATGPTLPGVMEFLSDRKESEELSMVVDEELKMMARVCDTGGRVVGPRLKQMARLAHTEYLIEGHTTRDPREILYETMLAPTVTGSPVESAYQVISRYEPQGRGYYSGVAALIGRDEHGDRCMDSAILIRTADIDGGGRLRIGVGATLVRNSDPASEAAETRAKAAGLLSALDPEGGTDLATHPRVRAALEERNTSLAGFWLADCTERHRPDPALVGRRVLVLDTGDSFTAMLGHQLRSLGPEVTVRRLDEPHTSTGHDLVVLGPGPGDPRDAAHPGIDRLRSSLRALLAEQQPFLAHCLSHQVLCSLLGFELARKEEPAQGVQREIDFFGRREHVGFYNTFTARSQEDKREIPDVGMVEVSRDARTGEVHGLRGPRFASVQFHPESLLTRDGVRITATLLKEVLDR